MAQGWRGRRADSPSAPRRWRPQLPPGAEEKPPPRRGAHVWGQRGDLPAARQRRAWPTAQPVWSGRRCGQATRARRPGAKLPAPDAPAHAPPVGGAQASGCARPPPACGRLPRAAAPPRPQKRWPAPRRGGAAPAAEGAAGAPHRPACPCPAALPRGGLAGPSLGGWECQLRAEGQACGGVPPGRRLGSGSAARPPGPPQNGRRRPPPSRRPWHRRYPAIPGRRGPPRPGQRAGGGGSQPKRPGQAAGVGTWRRRRPARCPLPRRPPQPRQLCPPPSPLRSAGRPLPRPNFGRQPAGLSPREAAPCRSRRRRRGPAAAAAGRPANRRVAAVGSSGWGPPVTPGLCCRPRATQACPQCGHAAPHAGGGAWPHARGAGPAWPRGGGDKNRPPPRPQPPRPARADARRQEGPGPTGRRQGGGAARWPHAPAPPPAEPRPPPQPPPSQRWWCRTGRRPQNCGRRPP